LGVEPKFFTRYWADEIPQVPRMGRGWRRFYTADIDRFKQSIVVDPNKEEN